MKLIAILGVCLMVHVVYAAFEPMFEDEVVDAEPVFEDGEMEEVEPGVWAPRETAEELSKPARAPFSANTPRELAELLREAYDKIVVDLEDDFLTPAHAEALWTKALNPDDTELTDEEKAAIAAGVNDFKDHEGLQNSQMPLYWGFVSRGSPMQKLITVNEKLQKGREERQRQLVADRQAQGIVENEEDADEGEL